MMEIMVNAAADTVGSASQMPTGSDVADVQARIDRLKAIRRRFGWSEEVCAYHLGVTYSTLNRWERGASLPRSRLVLNAIDHFIATHGKEARERG
jgi:DNA-binding transcriptional regulator YiaG